MAAENLFKELKDAKMDDWAVWDLMIRGYLYMNKYPTAEAILSELKKTGSVEKLNPAIFQRFIYYYAMRIMNTRKALHYIEQMEQLKIVPTEKSIVLLTTFLFYRERAYTEVIQLVDRFKAMLPEGKRPSPRLLTRVVQSYHNLNQHHQAIAAFHELLKAVDAQTEARKASRQQEAEEGLDEDVDNVATAQDEGENGEFDGSRESRAESDDHLEQHEFAAGVAIRSCLFAGEISEAIALFREIQLRNFRIHENCVHAIAQIIMRSGDVPALKKFFADLLELKPGPTAMSYPSIISVLITARQYQTAEELFQEFSPKVDEVARPIMLARLMEAYAKEKTPEDVDRILDICIKDFYALLQKGGMKQVKSARTLFVNILGHLSRAGKADRLEEFWVKATSPKSENGYGMRPQSFNLATLCEGLASVHEFGKAFEYAAKFVDRAKEGYFDLSYYFAVTFVAKVLLKCRAPLGNNYSSHLGRWLDRRGAIGRQTMVPTDKEDFIRDFRFWHQCWKDYEARENSLARKSAKISVR